jgi:type IV pilus assembly protein PilA
MKNKSNLRGFTLIELLLVIAIIAILAGVVFVALNPASRLMDARDSVRKSAAEEVLSAAKLNQLDGGGTYLAAITAMTAGNVYMIGTGTSGCTAQNANCDTDPTADTSCVDLTGLVTSGHLGSVPVSPNGSGAWTSVITGYTATKNSSGTLTIRACESENTTEISATR